MKIFAVLVLAAMVAYASANTESETSAADVIRAAASAAGGLYVGPIKETADGPVESVGDFTDPDEPQVDGAVQHGPPSCKLGKKIGNPICFGKCILKGKNGGYCEGKTCVCT